MYRIKSSLTQQIQNTITILAIPVLLLCFLQQAFAGKSEVVPWPAEKQPDHFILPDLQDNKHSLTDYRGKVVLVNFWASWCSPCVYEMPYLKKLKEHYNNEPFEILALNVGEKKYRVRKFIKLISFDLPVLLDADSETFDSWDAKTLPTSYLLDANGQVRYRFRGDPGWQLDNTRALIDKLIAESANAAKLE